MSRVASAVLRAVEEVAAILIALQLADLTAHAGVVPGLPWHRRNSNGRLYLVLHDLGRETKVRNTGNALQEKACTRRRALRKEHAFAVASLLI